MESPEAHDLEPWAGSGFDYSRTTRTVGRYARRPDAARLDNSLATTYDGDLT
jgi:hypothetical protein